MRMSWSLVVVVAACSSSNGSHPHDAAIDTKVDARPDAPPDAPPDAAIDAPAAPGGHLHFVEDHATLPKTSNEARASALDLDGNGTVDNQFGMVIAAFYGQGFDLPAVDQKAVDTGKIITLLDVTDTSVASFVGATPMPPACSSSADTVCRHHLSGTATFTVDPAAPTNPPLTGTTTTGVLTAGPGHLAVQLAWGPTSTTTLQLIGARVKLAQVSPTGIGSAIIAGGISQTEIDTKLIPLMQQSYMAQVTTDCANLQAPPGCGCTSGSTGATLISLFDANHDCSITVDEVRTNSLIQSLLATDITVENMPALSFGFTATAVPAGYVAP